MGRQTTVRRQTQVFIHTRLSRAYLALARLSCIFQPLAWDQDTRFSTTVSVHTCHPCVWSFRRRKWIFFLVEEVFCSNPMVYCHSYQGDIPFRRHTRPIVTPNLYLHFSFWFYIFGSLHLTNNYYYNTNIL